MEFVVEKIRGLFRNKKKMEEYNKSLPDGRYLIKIVPYKQRSLRQNSWFHAVLPEILQGLRDAGYDDIRTEEDAKDFVKALFFRKTVTNGVDSVDIVEGTSKQSKINFAEKSEDIIKWAFEYLGLDIAPPAEQLLVFHE